MAKLDTWNTRMIELMEFCVAGKIKCTTQDEWCKLIGIRSAGVAQIRSGRSSFRHEHVLKAAKIFNINVNWIYGISNEMHLQVDKMNPFAIIRSQLITLEKMVKIKPGTR